MAIPVTMMTFPWTPPNSWPVLSVDDILQVDEEVEETIMAQVRP